MILFFWVMEMNKILIIEDDKNIQRLLSLELKHKGYMVSSAYDGEEGLELFKKNSYDVVLLDLMLPEMNGLEVVRRLRQVKQTPVIIMTARDSVMDRVVGLDQGADDYVVKPFEIEEILARLRALFRRLQMEEQSRNIKQTKVEYRDLVIEVENRVVRRDGEVIDLTKKEYELLLLLMENIDIVLSREILLKKVWGYKNEVETNVIDVYVRYIRNKIDVPGKESYIQTVRGTGYVMRS